MKRAKGEDELKEPVLTCKETEIYTGESFLCSFIVGKFTGKNGDGEVYTSRVTLTLKTAADLLFNDFILRT